jgi:hypothetical protein
MSDRPDEPVTPAADDPEPAGPPADNPAPAEVSATDPAPSGPATSDPAPSAPAAGAAEPVTPAAGDPEPAGPVASDPEPVVVAESRPEQAGPRERRGGDRGAWGAVTDPIGQQAARAPKAPPATPATGEPTAAGAPEAGPRARSRPPVRSLDRGPGRPADGQPGRAVSRTGQSRRPDTRRPDSRRSAQSGGDVLSDLQRWLLRSGAKSVRREIEGQVRRTFNGGGRAERGDVWGTATTEPPPHVGESPECLWCPICRAARRMRDSGPGLGSQLSSAPSVVASAVQDAIVAFDAVLSRSAPAAGQERPADTSPASGPAGPADSASDEAEGPRDEPGDRG